jgi:hypothetical protein
MKEIIQAFWYAYIESVNKSRLKFIPAVVFYGVIALLIAPFIVLFVSGYYLSMTVHRLIFK